MRSLILPLSALVALGACVDVSGPTEPAEPQCSPITSIPVIERGDTVVTTTGLEYVDVTLGQGAQVESCQLLFAHLEGWIEDGTVFVDTTVDENPAHFWPGVQELPIGLAEGMIGMQAGGVRRLIVPPNLGYGAEPIYDLDGRLLIPAGSTLYFELSVLQIQD